MEDIQNLILNISWAGVAALFILKVLYPIINHLIKKSKNGSDYALEELEKRWEKHISNDHHDILRRLDNVEKELSEHSKKIVRLETIVFDIIKKNNSTFKS